MLCLFTICAVAVTYTGIQKAKQESKDNSSQVTIPAEVPTKVPATPTPSPTPTPAEQGIDLYGTYDENDLMIINKSGVVIRLKVTDVRVMGRATQGVRLINLGKRNDQIASVCKVLTSNDEEELEIEEGEVLDENVIETNSNEETEELINDNE